VKARGLLNKEADRTFLQSLPRKYIKSVVIV